MRHDRTRLAAGTVTPLLGLPGVQGQGRGDHRRVVLLRAVEAIRHLAVGINLINLCRRLVVLRRPGAPAVHGDVRAAVIGLDHDVAIAGTDPHIVIVAVRRGEIAERLAAIGRLEEAFGAAVDNVRIGRIGSERRVVERPGDQRCLAVDERPRRAGVVRAIEAPAGLRLVEEIQAIRICGRDGDVALADELVRQAGRQSDPVVSGIDALIDAALVRAADDRPRLPLAAPHHGEEDARIAGLHLDIGGAGAVGEVQHFLPVTAAVLRPIDPALGRPLEGIARRGDVHDIRIRRMHTHGADLPDVTEPGEVPCLSTVDGAIHAASDGDIAADVVGACADVDDSRVG